VKGLTKSYGPVRALRGIDLEVQQGEILGFLGPNGAGKTTTIRCLLDLIRPDEGTIRVLGRDPQADPVAVRARTGYLPGELQLYDNLTAEQQLLYFNELRGRQAARRSIHELAERFDLDLRRPIKNLSRGNKQKVGVIQALMARPELLLMDEPTSGLDPLMQQEVYRLIKEAQDNGATIFFSSHILSEVEAIAERVAIIRRGVIVEEARPGQLVDMAMRRLHVRFKEPIDPHPLTEVPGVSMLSQSDGTRVTLQVEGDMEPLVKALAGLPVGDLVTEHPSLEEIFLAYYETGEREGS
jgi:ABC-2 type transport system ATP-binding protein